jgi:predicted AlkP superfamily pyrophosphatase or phosphodiesterase
MMVPMRGLPLSIALAALLSAACASTSRTTGTAAPAASAPAPATAPPAAPARESSGRQRWLEMFARGYFPGRSGQVFVVPREGDVITERDPLYNFMHGSPWAYDSHIPILFYGQPFITKGQFKEAVSQQDIAPTLGAIIGAAPAQTYTGRVQRQALASTAEKPRIVMLIVLDAMRADYFDTHADVMPTLSRMRREGAWFGAAQATSLPTVTGVGHATIGTGTDPRFHGITVNNIFSRLTGRIQQAYDALDPRELMALTLADIWNLETDGKAVIIGQGGAIRATAGLVGRGACLVNGRKVIAASYSTRDAGWETNPTCYTMSDALKPYNGSAVWKAAGGTWMGHDIADGAKFRASSLFKRFEAEALLAVMAQEAIGADAVTDLVMVNMKGPDYTSHAHGPASAEQRETLAELDRQMAKILEMLDKKAGPGRSVVAVTADHGMPGEPAPGHRHHPEDITDLVHAKFDPKEKKVVQYYSDAANSQLYIDTARLTSLGFSLKDVAAFLETQEYYAAAFTEDEVRAAQLRLPSIR